MSKDVLHKRLPREMHPVTNNKTYPSTHGNDDMVKTGYPAVPLVT